MSLNKHSPWVWVFSIYVPFGLFNGFMQLFPQNLVKLLGFSNELVGLISMAGFIVSLRFLYAPWLDGATTKRRLVLIAAAVGAVLLAATGGMLFTQPSPRLLYGLLCALLALTALCSAAYETSADGYYIRALDPSLQAQFIGIKTTAIRFGMLTGVMGLMMGATKLAARYGATGVDSADKTGFHIGFGCAYLLTALILIGAVFFNKKMIPGIEQDQPVKHQKFALKETLQEYFRQERVVLMMALILLFRFGMGFVQVLRNTWLLDPAEASGMSAPAGSIPLYSILTDIPWTIVGGILGGYLIKWFGLKRTFMPLAFCASLPTFIYAILAWNCPAHTIQLFGEPLNTAVMIGSSLESLTYGLSFSALFYYMHITATLSGRNKTSILAISMCLMNIGFTIPMTISGYIQSSLNYTWTFVLGGAVSLLVLLIIPFLHLPETSSAAADTAER
jgi:PAT family beta-lactamase induction signal transducer AmpG